ncbi:MAG: hypothetical protein KAS67_06485 [Thermoplasmata archaeon]|nr:hypothetical protein [Thermoplasmata archaeon]
MRSLDNQGIEGLPLQLMIIMIVIVIAVPMSWNYLTSYSEKQAKQSVQDQLEYFEMSVKDVYSMGPGNVRVVELKLDGGSISKIEFIHMGGCVGDVWSNLSSCRYIIGGSQMDYYMITDPNIAIVNMTGVLELTGGSYSVQVKSLDEFITGIDADGDGVLYSRYVEIGVVP